MKYDDLDIIIRIEESSYSYPWTRGIFRDCLKSGYIARVVGTHESISGYGIIMLAGQEAHLLNLCVEEAQRRAGVARRLLTYLISIASKAGAESLFLEVRASNTAALALYLDYGFNEVGIRRGYYPCNFGREDALILAQSIL